MLKRVKSVLAVAVVVFVPAGMLKEGRQTFRYDTFGSEDFWGGKLRLHEAIVGQKLGGVGPGVSPKMALSLGLKVDSDGLPADLVAAIKAGKVNMDDPASTVALLKANAVVGVTAFLNADGSARSVGIQCALCHSTVDDSFAPGIGKRLDGWGNRDWNVGAIVATAPNLQPFSDLLGVDVATVKAVLNSWGPGRYDAELNMDGKAKRPDGKAAATMMPSAFGLAGVNQHTWTGGWGTVTYWNAYVANTQMYGKGTFIDTRLNDAKQYPVAAKAGWGRKRDATDLITAKLPTLHFYHSPCRCRRRPQGATTQAPRSVAKWCSTARRNAQRATCPRSLRSPATISTKEAKSGSTASRPIAGPSARMSPRHCVRCSTPRKSTKPGSITTAASRRSLTSWTTTIVSSNCD